MAAVATDVTKKMENMKIKTDINILLLGESGVGKSTFINAMANYLNFGSDFKLAEKNELVVLIPSQFTMDDKTKKKCTIVVGDLKDQNEQLHLGHSATQDVKTYVFPIYNNTAKVRLIDTPGLVDTRGIEQDDVNCENILNYIGQLHELHAICILLKPNVTRITPQFEYCLKKILSHLHKSAAANILFCFTNTRGSNYSPGDTYSCIEKIIEGIEKNPPNVKIPFDKNKFCFDNEAFRYLAAIKSKIEIDGSIRNAMIGSWKKSYDECWRLIKYIVGDKNSPELKPHLVKATVSINEVRRLINYLSQPLADISQNINQNIRVLERHRYRLAVQNQSVDELKQNLYMPVLNLKVTKLTQPVTVCAASKCMEVLKVEDMNRYHYKTRCHDPCYLSNVPKEIVGAPELINCAAMAGTKTCTKCGCDVQLHMHIYYMTKVVSDKVKDGNVESNITDRQRAIQEAQKIVGEIENRVTELKEEHKVVTTAAAQFAHFLQRNALTPFNDSYKEYIKYIIQREKSLGPLADKRTIEDLEKLILKYDEIKATFNEALKLGQKLNTTDYEITPEKVKKTIDDLYRLKHNGEKIKELYKSQKAPRDNEYKKTEEYIHKTNFIANMQKQQSSAQSKPSSNANKPKPKKVAPPSYDEAVKKDQGNRNANSRPGPSPNYPPNPSQSYPYGPSYNYNPPPGPANPYYYNQPHQDNQGQYNYNDSDRGGEKKEGKTLKIEVKLPDTSNDQRSSYPSHEGYNYPPHYPPGAYYPPYGGHYPPPPPPGGHYPPPYGGHYPPPHGGHYPPPPPHGYPPPPQHGGPYAPPSPQGGNYPPPLLGNYHAPPSSYSGAASERGESRPRQQGKFNKGQNSSANSRGRGRGNFKRNTNRKSNTGGNNSDDSDTSSKSHRSNYKH